MTAVGGGAGGGGGDGEEGVGKSSAGGVERTDSVRGRTFLGGRKVVQPRLLFAERAYYSLM